MKRLIYILFFINFCIVFAQAQPVMREFRIGFWGMFPWVEPNENEKTFLEETNANHINAWILNPNDNVYIYYPGAYPDFSETGIMWLERRWMDYLDTTGIGMYVGYNGMRSGTDQYANNQIEYFARYGNTTTFRNIFNSYLSEFGLDSGLQGYYVSTEDIQDTTYHSDIEEILQYIRTQDPNHELVIEHWDLGADLWAADNADKYDIFERTFYVFEEGDAYAGLNHQSDLGEIIRCANENQVNLAGTNVDWHAIIQTYSYDTPAKASKTVSSC